MSRLLLSDEVIQHLYQVEKKSVNFISRTYNSYDRFIKNRLIKIGVSLRTRRECYDLMKGKMWGEFPINNPIPKTINPKPLHKVKLKPKLKQKEKNIPINRFEIFARDGFRCCYCGSTPNDGIKLIMEHIIPKSQGGSNDSSNLITACNGCNVSKGNKMLLTKNKQIPSFIAITSLSIKQK